jgi:transposase-like protein
MADRINWSSTPIVETMAVACPFCEATKPIRKDMDHDGEGRWRFYVCRRCSKPFRNFEKKFRRNGVRVFRIGDA